MEKGYKLIVPQMNNLLFEIEKTLIIQNMMRFFFIYFKKEIVYLYSHKSHSQFICNLSLVFYFFLYLLHSVRVAYRLE